MLRRLVQLASFFSALVLLILIGLLIRSSSRVDVVLLRSGRESCFLLTSHKGGWIELAAFTEWPEPHARWWSGSYERDVGPFKLWAAHRPYARYRVHLREGQLILPRAGPGQGILGEGAYDQAVRLGYPGRLSNGDPGWIMVRGWEIALPMAYPLAAAAVLPLGWMIGRLLRRARRGRRLRANLCGECGYDLRATVAGQCPECGVAIARRAQLTGAPSTPHA
jgi:hypothetical protein